MDPKAAAERFDTRADSYDASGFHRWQTERAAAFALEVAGGHPLGRVLDVCTGTGLFLRALVAAGADASALEGLDVSERMLDIARQELPAASFTLGDAADPPDSLGVFGLISCQFGLMLLDDPGRALTSWVAHLEPAGRVLLGVPAASGRVADRALVGAASREQVELDEPEGATGGVDALDALAAAAGLVRGASRTEGFRDAEASAEQLVDASLRYDFAAPVRDLPAPVLQRIRRAAIRQVDDELRAGGPTTTTLFVDYRREDA